MEVLRRVERSTVGAMCRVQLKDRKIAEDLMLMLGLNETIDQLAMTNSICLYGHVFCEGGWACVHEGGWSCVQEGGWSCV